MTVTRGPVAAIPTMHVSVAINGGDEDVTAGTFLHAWSEPHLPVCLLIYSWSRPQDVAAVTHPRFIREVEVVCPESPGCSVVKPLAGGIPKPQPLNSWEAQAHGVANGMGLWRWAVL